MSDSDSDTTSTGTRELLRVVIGGEEYAFPVGDTETVIDWKEPTGVPNSHDAIDGLIEVRGEIAVLVRPQEFLSTDASSDEFGIDEDVIVSSGVSSEHPVLIMDASVDSQRIGFVIDSVIGVSEYPESDFRPSSSMSDSDSKGVESGVLTSVVERAEGSVIGVLDVHTIIENSKSAQVA